MIENQQTASPDATPAQLTAARIPLRQASDTFLGTDAYGRTPIVVLTERQNRIYNAASLSGVIVLVAGVLWGILQPSVMLIIVSIVLGLLLLALGISISFRVRIPEGVNALLMLGGKYKRTIESGTYFLSPYYIVSHLVTRRAIPFVVRVSEVPTQDNVRVIMETLITFIISDPYRFVYHISANDFDQVFQAACQSALRAVVRQVTSEQVNDLTQRDTAAIQATLSQASEPYGVKILGVHITSARCPLEFQLSQEARQLATLQKAEQAEQQTLALLKLDDEEALARRRVIARVEREREELRIAIQQAEARKQVIELEADAEELRLAKLEHRLAQYPKAAQWEWDGEQLKVARGLASNTHAVVQVGEANDIARAFLMRNVSQQADSQQHNGATTDTSAEGPAAL